MAKYCTVVGLAHTVQCISQLSWAISTHGQILYCDWSGPHCTVQCNKLLYIGYSLEKEKVCMASETTYQDFIQDLFLGVGSVDVCNGYLHTIYPLL